MIDKVYDPHRVEEKWYRFWEEKGYFSADENSPRKPFCIAIPPPNVTGSLHMGHALNNTIQDILIRWRKMQGYESLWVPGTDHAGIATQNQVERKLAREGKTRFDLGREKFEEEVWNWKEKYGKRIIEQLKKLGASCDWERERFTLDEGLSEAVRESFARYYKKGLIYRGERIINWCPRCGTAISDLEVRYNEVEGKLYYINYPIAESKKFITVATTRPETMLGDTAVAVNPEDSRYKKLVGKTAMLPLVNREIPIIEDELVDPKFGTGAVKVTPCHDPNDFEIGKREKLDFIKVIDENGRITHPLYKGLSIEKARNRIVKDLKNEKLLVKIESYTHSVGSCARCETTVEPMVSKQWFVKMKPLAEPAIKVVKNGKVKFYPKRWAKVYLNWMYNIKDWCISRQLWWGHRIPVWYCKDCNNIMVTVNTPKVCEKCGSKAIYQDADVLDTWFSSALWPLSTLGWPKATKDLAKFYPTNVLSTDPDIIYLWVARMIISGLEFMNQTPFKDVYIHSTVLNEKGERMSRSKGIGADPLDLINKFGTDALRFTLTYLESQSQSFRLWEDRFEMGRNFANKIWNATRLVLPYLSHFEPKLDERMNYELSDRWILSEYTRTIKSVTDAFKHFNFSTAASTLYSFFWHEFCDWYLELAKSRLYRKDTTCLYVIWYVLEGTLKLLHPIMPFITEELWQKIPHKGESIMVSSWPVFKKKFIDNKSEVSMNIVKDVVSAIRNIRSELRVPSNKKGVCLIKTDRGEIKELIEKCRDYVLGLSKVESIEAGSDAEKPEHSAVSVISGAEIYLPLKGLIDFEVERKRIEKERDAIKRELTKVNKKFLNEAFISRAPKEVIEKTKVKKIEYEEKLHRLEENLKSLL